MRALLLMVLPAVCTLSMEAQEPPFAKVVKASLVFHEDFNASHRDYPHVLKAFLRLDNAWDSSVSWISDSVIDVEAEVFDAANKPVPTSQTVSSILTGSDFYFLPCGSRLDWLLSHGGVTLDGNVKNSYALVLGGRGWLLPIRQVGTYRLRVRLRGEPWATYGDRTDKPRKLLLDLAPVKIKVTR